jgi:dihydroorotase-like cyclic amidohydrolase
MAVGGIRNGLLVLPQGIIEGGVVIEDGRVAAIASNAHLPSGGDMVDARGLLVLPGLVDPEAHLGSNRALDQDFRTESQAAVAWGVTTWNLQLTSHTIYRAAHDRPSPEKELLFGDLVNDFVSIGRSESHCDFMLTPILMSIDQARQIPDLAMKHGVSTFKLYMHMRLGRSELTEAWPQAPLLGVRSFDDSLVYVAMREVARLGRRGLLSLHCENWEIARVIEKELREAGRTDPDAWNERSPGYLEAMHVRTYSYLARQLGCRMYVQHVSAPETLEAIVAARQEGTEIYGQTAAHYLVLDAGAWKLNTPLRPQAAHDPLWRALREGVVNCVGSDHVNRGLARRAMEKDSVWESISGFPSRVEGHLPLLLTEGVAAGRLSLSRLCQVACENPARLWGVFPRKGSILVGADADFVLIDLKKRAKLTAEHVLSSTGWSIYEGREIIGWPMLTILRGEVVASWESGRPIVTAAPRGEYLARTAIDSGQLVASEYSLPPR